MYIIIYIYIYIQLYTYNHTYTHRSFEKKPARCAPLDERVLVVDFAREVHATSGAYCQ